MKIHLLDENTINMIAAGEVIENPSNVVKELVENSIDAAAKHITVEVSSDITSLIKVVDDGIGFDKDDIKTAFYKHATSKLKNLSDIYSIDSYGFRGEALSSIASVSDVTLVTKTARDKAYKYKVSYGKASDIEETSANNGTCIIIKDLFKNTPVRKKFLKSDQKEIASVYDIIEKISYINTDISFTFIVDKKVKFKTSGDKSLKNVIFDVYGRDIYDSLIEINETIKDIKITGFIAKPIVARNNKNDIIYFVNKRFVKSKILTRAIEDSYSTYLMQHKYPLCVLCIDIDKSAIDINVHPKKEEVRFESEDVIYYAVYNTLYSAISTANLIHEEKLNYQREQFVSSEEKYDFNANTENIVSKSIDDLESLNIEKDNTLLNSTRYERPQQMVEKPFIQKTLTEDHKYIGQIFGTYILVEYDEKLYMIDQHAAHEKINFERLMDSFKKGECLSQKIFPSIVLKLTPKQYIVVEENLADFKKIGYEIEIFGDNDIKVDAVPYNLLGMGAKDVLLEMIDNFINLDTKENYDSVVEKIASISCKMSVKANHILSEIEVKNLLRDLFKLENPYNCPHGRPTIISLSKYEFEKRFGRIV